MVKKKGKKIKFSKFPVNEISTPSTTATHSPPNNEVSNAEDIKCNENADSTETSSTFDNSADASVISISDNNKSNETFDNSGQRSPNHSDESVKLTNVLAHNESKINSEKVLTSGIENLSVGASANHSDESEKLTNVLADNESKINNEKVLTSGTENLSVDSHSEKVQRQENKREYLLNKEYHSSDKTRNQRPNPWKNNFNDPRARTPHTMAPFQEKRNFNYNERNKWGNAKEQRRFEDRNYKRNTYQHAESKSRNMYNTTQNNLKETDNDVENEDWDKELLDKQPEHKDNTSNSPINNVLSTESLEVSGKQLNVDAQEFTPPDSYKDNIKPRPTDNYFGNNYQVPSDDSKYNETRHETNWRQNDNRKSLPMPTFHKDSALKRYSEGNNFNTRWSKGNSNVVQGRDERRSDSTDSEYRKFCEEERNTRGEIEFTRVKEIQGDLFAMPKEYSLAHCVAEDMRMGSGIAVAFKREFKDLGVLLNQKQRQGGLAVLESENDGTIRYVYYLVTKRESTGKPTYEKFWSSLKKMRDHISENRVEKLAIPRLGCGLDRLEWSRVKHMLEFLFRDVNVEITVCNFQQTEESLEKPLNYTCKVVNVQKSIADIEAETTIIYLSTTDGYVSEEMLQLSKKFNFLLEFKTARKQLGDVVKYEVPKKFYILYGCIVRKRQQDPFDFVSFGKCISQINKNNKKDKYIYIGLQAIKDDYDSLLMEKILTMLKNQMAKVDIYVCWYGDLADKMPVPRDSFN